MLQQIKTTLYKQRGSSILGALFTLLVLGFTGMAAIEISSGESTSTINEMQGIQALYVGQAGIEYAKQRVDNGLSPDVEGKPFGAGTFSVYSNPLSELITVTSQVGIASRSQSINAKFAQQCIELDTSAASVEGANLKNIRLIKTCNTAATLTTISLDWNFGDCQTQVGQEVECDNEDTNGGDNDSDNEDENNDNVNNDEDDDEDDDEDEDDEDDYDQYADPDHPGKILICHVPPGNPANAHTLSVSISGWENGHDRGNGKHDDDYLGPCGNPPQDDDDDDDEEEEEEEEDEDEDEDNNEDEDEDDNGCENEQQATLAECDDDDHATQHTHNSYKVMAIGMAGTNTLYDALDSIGTPAITGAEAAAIIDLQDFVLTSNGTYTFVGAGENPTTHIEFNQTLPINGWYNITVKFADGSELTSSFIIGDQGVISDNDNDNDENNGDDDDEEEEVCTDPENNDDDNDGTLDVSDNCPQTTNTDQVNTDADSMGDACDNDDDGDGVEDDADNCPLTMQTTQADNDGDGLGNECDPTPDPDPGFEVDDGELVTDPNQNVEVEVIGSSITYGAGGPEIEVKMELGLIDLNDNITYTTLFNWNDVDGGETYTTTSGTGKSYFVRATATYKKKFSAVYDSRNVNQVKTLTNGQLAPPLQGFGGQKPVTDFLEPYLDNEGRVVLAYNQAIILFELGTTNLSSSAADFQDLVVLVTFTPEFAPQENQSGSEGVQYKQVGDTLKKTSKSN